MTNREKFKEVFGFSPNKGVSGNLSCPAPKKICDERKGCVGCPFKNWWEREYKECFRMKEEFEDD